MSSLLLRFFYFPARIIPTTISHCLFPASYFSNASRFSSYSSPTKVSSQYRELQKNSMKMICASTNMLAQQKEVSLDELRQEPLVVFDSPKIFSNIAQLQAKLMENRDISDLHFCSSAESIAVLVASGYGISVLPDVLIQENHRLVKVPIKDISPTSLGIYYKSLQCNPALKLLIDEARVIFSHDANG